MVSAFHALTGLAGLVCSTILTLGFISAPVTASPDDQSAQAAVAAEAEPVELDSINEEDEGLGTYEAGELQATLVADGQKSSNRPRTIRRVLRVTAYNDRGTTAAGTQSGVGQCAAPADVPFGSTIYIPALKRTLVVTDRTHRRFRHNTVDIFMPGKQQCRNFGRQYLECVITPPDAPVKYGELAKRL